MATTAAMPTDVKKLSFAKVVASGSRDKAAPRPSAAHHGTPSPQPRESKPVEPQRAPNLPTAGDADGAMASHPVEPPVAQPAEEDKVVEGLKELSLATSQPSLVVNGSGSISTDRSSKAGNSQTPSDEASQKADSNSELGTKPPSLDGKSITSGTTFNALDEKESLRPDDSASVKAAGEDDDTFSIRGSMFPNSRMGSEVAARVHRIQIGDMPPRTITQILPDSRLRGSVTPQSVSSGPPAMPDSHMPLAAATSAPDAINTLYRQNPDDKLLEAMRSPKDRLFLLRLEKDVIEFVQDSKEPFMDLPPCNSFCRLLTHKLADYYHMTHSFEAVAGAVRIYRTPFCRVPPSLASIAAANETTSSTPPPALLPRKIMRRGEDGEFAASSAGPSKPTSEDGSDSKDKNAPTKEKLSREEREQKYNQARERIFGSSAPTETSTPDNEDGTGISRASSVSAKDKSNMGKNRKTSRQRRDDSESFDSRSQYTPYYGHPQQTTWVSPQYVPVGTPQYAPQMQPQQFPGPMQPAPYVPPPNQGYQQMMPANGYPQGNNMQTYPVQQSPQRYQQPPATTQMPNYAAPMQTTPQQAWQAPPNFNQSPYQSRAVPSHLGIPYAYGQLPVNANPNDPKSQHPIPGSYAGNYNRHGFNPKTQSFVPGGTGMSPMQTHPIPYTGPQQIPVAPQVGQPHYRPDGFQQPMPPQPQYGANGAGYGMMRQGSNTSLPPYPMQHPPQQPTYPVPLHMAPNPHQQHLTPSGPPPHIPNKPVAPQVGAPMAAQVNNGGGGNFSHLPNYGNPATLPQKPTTN